MSRGLTGVILSTLVLASAGCEQPAEPVQLLSAAGCNTPTTPFCNAIMSPTAGYAGPVFRLSQDYPASAGAETMPWKAFDPTSEAERLAYLSAVLAYVYEGNLAASSDQSFDLHSNTVRRWYHAPWQDFGVNGREFVHGLTRERSSEPGELTASQTERWHNYAVGFYNAPGGYTIGQVWANRGRPDPTRASFPEGTVAAKLLFTTAPVEQAPFLRGAPEWTGFLYSDPHVRRPQAGDPRQLMTLRLLQIDVAVKDSRLASTTGWVFATFVYGGALSNIPGSGWANVHPVGAMWGNRLAKDGQVAHDEGYLNPAVRLQQYGYEGRLNGPVDNPVSSCLSCHATAQTATTPVTSMVPVPANNPAYFVNRRSGEPFTPGETSMDYSLQLSTGIINFTSAQPLGTSPSLSQKNRLFNRLDAIDPRPPRDGGTGH